MFANVLSDVQHLCVKLPHICFFSEFRKYDCASLILRFTVSLVRLYVKSLTLVSWWLTYEGSYVCERVGRHLTFVSESTTYLSFDFRKYDCAYLNMGFTVSLVRCMLISLLWSAGEYKYTGRNRNEPVGSNPAFQRNLD